MGETMNPLRKAQIVGHMLKWRLTWDKRNTHFKFQGVPDNPKFMSAYEAAGLIKDGDVISTSGLGANQRASIMYWAIRELYEKTGHPKNLTCLSVGGQGSRGKAPGSVEELAQTGLLTRFFAGHLETFKAQLKMADEGKLEIQCIPQGTMCLLFKAQANGNDSLLLKTGIGTFCDPRVGRGSPLLDPSAEQFITVEGDMLRYRLPRINCAIFNAPAADREGNIYVKNAAMIGEAYEMSIGAKKNGGKVIANVGLLVDKGYDKVFLPADKIDAVVMYPPTEQTGSYSHKKKVSYFCLNSKDSMDKAIEEVKFVNQFLGLTPRRTPSDNAVARLAASVFAENARKNMYVNIGVGLPEEVSRLLYEGGLFNDITLLTESGVLGGVPAPGIFFGAGICPKEIISSAEIFERCYKKLDVTILGTLQVDSQGNVNVSKRGKGAINYVGPGGFIDLTTAAKMIIFVGSWMANKKSTSKDGKTVVTKIPKYVEKVDEVTFSGQEALKNGKKVFYVTNVGVFTLTEQGVQLIKVMPGIDIQKDILDVSPMKIIVPKDGKVPVVGQDIVTGENFKLALKP